MAIERAGSCLRAAGAIVAVVVIVAGFGGSARAQDAVLFGGGGTVASWTTFTGGVFSDGAPAALKEALPIGASFESGALYWPSGYHTTFSVFDNDRYFWGNDGFGTFQMLVNGHIVLPVRGSAEPMQLLIVREPRNDYIDLGKDASIDEQTTFAGYEVTYASMRVRGFNDELTSVDSIPTSICLAEWDELQISITFRQPGTNVVHSLRGTGTPARSVDSDIDGVDDGTELLHACINPCAGNTDADGDGVLDRVEILELGTNPCNADTDGDGLPDDVDPDPVVPNTGTEDLPQEVRDTANEVLTLPEDLFSGPNANAQRGRRGALSNRLQDAANAIEAGNLEEARQILMNVLKWLDGDPSPPDVLEDGPEKDALRAAILELIAALG